MKEYFKEKEVALKYDWPEQEKLFLLKPYLKMVGDTRGRIILDIGCGNG